MPTQPYKNSQGKRLPGVTTILGSNLGWDTQMLVAWARKIAMAGGDPNVIRDEAADTGTLAHYIIECFVNKLTPDYEKQYTPEQKTKAVNCVQGFKLWKDRYAPEFITSELSLVNDQYGFGGTIDIISKIDGSLVINDIKTNNHVSPKMVIQVSAYKKLYEMHTNEHIKWCEIIQLNKDKPEYKLYRFNTELLDQGWKAFEMLLQLHKMKKQFEPELTHKEGIQND